MATPGSMRPGAPARGGRWDLLRIALGLLLLAAAGLKAHQLVTQPTPERNLLTYRWFQIVWVEAELLLGLVLLAGFWKRLAWGVAVGCFGVFASVTLAKALHGEVSCGCFGIVEVSPWKTLILDLAVLVALALFRPGLRTATETPRRRLRLAAAAGVFLAAGIPVAILATAYRPAGLAEDGRILGDQRFVLLEPAKWVGARCPILKHIDTGAKLQKGRWTLVLYHHDCPHCEKRVPEFEREARRLAGRAGDGKVAMVELAPYAPPGRSLLPPDTTCLKGKVNNERDWFVETPTVLTLLGGVVVDAKEGEGRGRDEPARLAGLTPAPGEKAVPYRPEGFDFGFVEPGSVHKVLLAIPNATARPLAVTKVRSECACMSAVATDKPARPGETLSVRVVLVAPPKSQPYNKRILLQTDDTRAPPIPIPIKAAVGLPLVAEPSPLDAGTLARGEERVLPVTVVNRDRKPVRLLYSTSTGSGCFARVPREAVPAQGRLAVPVVIRAQAAGAQNVTLSIQTDSSLQASLSVPVRFTVEEPAGKVQGTGAAGTRLAGRSGEVLP